MKKSLASLLFLLVLPRLYAQHQELNEQPGLWKTGEAGTDTTSLLSAFKRGRSSGHFRYFFSATDNARTLSDYHAHALGGGIKLETARFRNIQLGISGFFVFNIGSSDLSLPDPLTRMPNRYEVGLFDIENPGHTSNISRLEELYVKYHFRKASLTAGRQLINTPFVNLQDGRMRPTEVQGIRAEGKIGSAVKWEAAYLDHISPRSTVRWFSVARSIGVYSSGYTALGTKSDYAGNLRTKGIFLAGFTWQASPNWKLQGWNQFTHNIFNSALLQADHTLPLKNKSSWFSGLQLVRQDALHNGGNPDPLKSYILKGSKAWVLSLRTGWKDAHWETSLNYTRITAHGRYLMPREWGRDPFFTFLPRERNEGLGDVHAWVWKLNRAFPKARFSSGLAAGYFHLPAVTDYALNKYGMPSYRQVNLDLRYAFAGWLKGFDLQGLIVYKGHAGNRPADERYVINKVDMLLWNIVLNFHF